MGPILPARLLVAETDEVGGAAGAVQGEHHMLAGSCAVHLHVAPLAVERPL